MQEVEGTTYVPDTDRQTDRQSDGMAPEIEHYISVRVTLPHDLFPELRDSVFQDYEEYVAYAHLGKSKDNPHFHILIPAGKATADSLRQRLRRHFSASGNKCYSVKSYDNGIGSGIQYCSREGSDPIVRGPGMYSCIAAAPKWVDRDRNMYHYMKDGAKRRKVDEMHFYVITFRNIEKVTLDYRKRKGIKSDQLEETLTAMHADNWRLDRQLTERGIPATVYDEFTAKCHGHTSWTVGRFSRMRMPPTWMSI